MKVLHNGKAYNIPASIDEISLKQVIGFQLKYGRDLEQFLADIGTDDELEHFEVLMDMACKSVSFFSGIPLAEVYQTNMGHIIGIYQTVLAPIFQQQNDERTLQESYFFKDQLWTIASPTLEVNSDISFNEMIIGKEITKDLQNFAGGRFEALWRLAVIYFRPEGEKFNEEWLQEGSERMEQLAELPMNIVLDIAFFLQSSMKAFLNSLSSEVGNEEKDPTSRSILTNGAG